MLAGRALKSRRISRRRDPFRESAGRRYATTRKTVASAYTGAYLPNMAVLRVSRISECQLARGHRCNILFSIKVHNLRLFLMLKGAFGDFASEEAAASLGRHVLSMQIEGMSSQRHRCMPGSPGYRIDRPATKYGSARDPDELISSADPQDFSVPPGSCVTESFRMLSAFSAEHEKKENMSYGSSKFDGADRRLMFLLPYMLYRRLFLPIPRHSPMLFVDACTLSHPHDLL